VAEKDKENSKTKEKENSPTSKLQILSRPIYLAPLLVLFIFPIIFFFLLSTDKSAPLIKEENQVNLIEIEDIDSVLSGIVYRLEPFTINLKDNSGVLFVTFSLQFYDFSLPPEIEHIEGKIRDLIIEETSRFSADEILKNGPSILKDPILQGLNLKLTIDQPIEDVYIENIVIR